MGMDPARVLTATAISAGVATLVMAFLGKLPIALAPGMGTNFFLAFAVGVGMGFSWQTAIAAVFVEGVLCIILTLTKIREKVIDSIPDTIKKAVALGIGMMIAVIGLREGGLLVGGDTGFAIVPPTSGSALLVVIGLAITVILYALKVPGSIFIGIIGATIIGIPLGVTHFNGIVGIPAAPYTPIDIIGGLTSVKFLDFLVLFISLGLVDFFDTISTFAGIAEQSNLKTRDGKIRNIKNALLADCSGTVIGSLFGSTCTTSYVESAAGVAAGGRTGLTSVVTGCLFIVAVFLSPLFLAIPSAAVAGALVFVGFLMLGAVSNLDFTNVEIGLPTFITVLMLTASLNITEGLAWGFITYTLVKVCKGKTKEVSISTWILTAIFLIKILFIHV
jgi:AGZA family xanthine/uracil permease-like MFS transporter